MVAPRTAPDIFDAAMMQQQTSPNSPPAASAAAAAYPAATKQTTTPDRGAGGGALMNKKRASTSAARAGRGGGAIVTRRFGQSVGVTTRAGGSGSVLRQPQHTSSTNTRRALDFIAVPLNQQQPSRRPHATSTSYIPNLTPIENDDIVTTTTTAAATAAAGRSGIVARRKAVALHEVLMEDDDNQEEKTDSSPPRRTIGLNADQHHHWIERNDTRGATARYEYPEIPPLDDDTMTILRNVASPARTHHNHQQQVTPPPPTTGLAGTGGAQLLPPPPPSALSSPSARTHHNHRQQVTTPPSTVRAGAVGAQLPPPPPSALAAAPSSSSPLRPRHISFHEGSPFSSPQRAISTTTTTTMPTTTMHWKVQWKFSMAMSSDVVRNCVMNNLARHHNRRNMRLVSRDWRNTYAASEFVLVAKHGDSFPRIAHVVALGAKVRMEFFEYDASTQASRDVQSLRLAILHSVPIDLRSSKSAPPPRTLLTCNAKFSDAMEFNSRYLMKVMCNACSERGVEFVQNDGLDMLLLRIDEAEKAHIRDEEDRRRREAARRQREAAWGVSAIESVARRVKARSKHRL